MKEPTKKKEKKVDTNISKKEIQNLKEINNSQEEKKKKKKIKVLKNKKENELKNSSNADKKSEIDLIFSTKEIIKNKKINEVEKEKNKIESCSKKKDSNDTNEIDSIFNSKKKRKENLIVEEKIAAVNSSPPPTSSVKTVEFKPLKLEKPKKNKFADPLFADSRGKLSSKIFDGLPVFQATDICGNSGGDTEL
ncbi:hypothetical protein HK099_003939, partial [Clydaea vesicula]